MIDFSKITEQKISEKFQGLPQDLKDVLSSADTSVIIGNIATKYRLDEEKTAMLIQLVGLVILGFVSFENMKEEMKETIDISSQFIPLIADEIRQKIFSPVINSLQPAPVPVAASPAPAITPRPAPPPATSTDQYREPASSVPEVVDLRKTPPSPAEAGYGGQRPPTDREGGLSPGLPIAPAPSLPPKQTTVSPTPTPATVPVPTPTPKPVIPAPPLTFTRPVEPATPLIKAEPHKVPSSAPRPQYIMRPSGLPPTDLPENVLDLRKDRGEF